MKLTLWHASALALLVLSGFCSTAAAALTGAYAFDEASGTTAFDSSGNSRNGTLTGAATATPTRVPGIYTGSTGALQFNWDSSTSSYVNARIDRVALPANTGFIQNAPAMTMMAWVRADAIANQGGANPQVGSSRSIVSVSETAGGTRGVLQLISANGQIRVLGRRVDGGSSASFTTTASALALNKVYFVVGILDYVGADIRIFVNGVQQAGTPAGFANLGVAGPTNLSANNTNAAAFIGTNTAGAGEQWNGLIDGVRIFNHALTAQEILATYNAEKAPEPTALVSACLGMIGLVAANRRRRRA